MKKRFSGKPLVNTADALPDPIQKVLYSLFLKPGMELILGVDKLNKTYEYAKRHAKEDDPGMFAEKVFECLHIQYDLPQAEIENLKKIEGPIALVCNHPYGGLEALFMVLLMSKIRPDFRIMANYMLGRVSEVKNVLTLVDPFGGEDSKQKNVGALRAIFEFLKKGGMIGVFPSGEVASLDIKTGKIREPEWNPNISKLIQRTGASVVPIYFHGTNSMLFHLAGLIHPRLRTTLIVREFVHPRTHKLRFKIGKVITPEKIARYPDPEELTQYLKSKTYLLRTTYTQTKSASNWSHPFKHLIKKGEKEIISAVPKPILCEEITRLGESHLLYEQAPMQVYLFKAMEAPALMIELGRMREVTFRLVGEGTGKNLDLDDYDQYYEHLIVWNKDKEELVGAYRIARCDDVIAEKGIKGLYIASLFDLDAKLFSQINPSLELGRSIVCPDYQRSFLPLMLLWTGIGHVIARNRKYINLIGPVSISNSYKNVSRHFIIEFLKQNYLSPELAKLARPKHPFKHKEKSAELYSSLPVSSLNDVQELLSDVEHDDMTKVPILIKHYLKLGSKVLGFNVDPDFQDAVDALMLTNIPRIPADTLQKYMGEKNYQDYCRHHNMNQ
jgi:putative hemolysin